MRLTAGPSRQPRYHSRSPDSESRATLCPCGWFGTVRYSPDEAGGDRPGRSAVTDGPHSVFVAVSPGLCVDFDAVPVDSEPEGWNGALYPLDDPPVDQSVQRRPHRVDIRVSTCLADGL